MHQVNYLIDEGMVSGKGANTVISLIHHALENYGLGEEKLHLHADNCSGQNKNNAMIEVSKLLLQKIRSSLFSIVPDVASSDGAPKRDNNLFHDGRAYKVCSRLLLWSSQEKI